MRMKLLCIRASFAINVNNIDFPYQTTYKSHERIYLPRLELYRRLNWHNRSNMRTELTCSIESDVLLPAAGVQCFKLIEPQTISNDGYPTIAIFNIIHLKKKCPQNSSSSRFVMNTLVGKSKFRPHIDCSSHALHCDLTHFTFANIYVYKPKNNIYTTHKTNVLIFRLRF